MKVFVYFNLHKKMWSIKALEGEMKGRVIKHTNYLILKNCICKVSQAGRKRVLAERRKNVHAGVVGTMVEDVPLLVFTEQITYNPYKYDSFVNRKTLAPVHDISWVTFQGKHVYALKSHIV